MQKGMFYNSVVKCLIIRQIAYMQQCMAKDIPYWPFAPQKASQHTAEK